MALTTYPLNNVDYLAEDAELYNCPRKSGVYVEDDFDCSVTGEDNTITIGTGLCWIRNSQFSGKVAALKAAMTLDLGLPDTVYPRIDAVVIQFDANSNQTAIVVKQGTAASTPVAPEVVKTEVLYELHLYHVRREAGATAVTIADITDLRIDESYCGLMADSVTSVDTKLINAKATLLIAWLEKELSEVKDGSAYLMKSGGTMAGPIDMNGQSLTGLNAPVNDSDAVPKSYLNQFMTESTDHPGCYYRTADGAVEWINPPMTIDTEYRTTERFYGKTVYVKTFTTANAGGTTVSLGDDVSSVIRASGRCGARILPLIDASGNHLVWTAIDGNSVSFYAATAYGNLNVELTVWYVKTT